MKKLILTRGLPGSGKTYWALRQVEHNPTGVAVLCRDDIRQMHGGFHVRREPVITAIQRAAVRELANTQNRVQEIIIADTNLNPRTLESWKQLAADEGLEFVIKDFTDVDIDTCVQRDLQRTRSVGERVIRDMHNKYLAKRNAAPASSQYLWGKPKAIIVDLDGTLAIMKDRGPYDWHLVGNDEVNPYVLHQVQNWAEKHPDGSILFVSGRSEDCRDLTSYWLRRVLPENQFTWQLYMRPAGDNRKDVIIKQEIWENYIQGNYNILAVFDDRLQVCRLWHSLGLPLFRVGDPDANF